MKIVLVILISSYASFLFADCRAKLSNNYSNDSSTINVYADFGDHVSDEDAAKILVQRALVIAGCKGKELTEFLPKSFSCKQLSEKRSYSMACFGESNGGYYFIMKDMVDTANVVFNRWD
ncbi:MAG: hypothetical protein AB8E15_05575 [Bdellovibrionales bacterium]